jgi:hypothetical protein
MNLQKMARNLGKTVGKNSPTILTALGVTGLFTTVILAVKATPKALIILDEEAEYREAESENGEIEPINVRDIIALTWKCYLPAGVMGVLTAACIISSNSINIKRNKALAGAYLLAETALKDYQAKVIENMGKEKHREIKGQVAQDKIVKNPVSKSEVIPTGKGETLCFDALSGRYFMSDRETIRAALNNLSRDLMSEMFITLNQVYYELGLEGTKLGEQVGWHLDQVDSDLIQPEFDTKFAEDGRPCLVLDFETQPMYWDRD